MSFAILRRNLSCVLSNLQILRLPAQKKLGWPDSLHCLRSQSTLTTPLLLRDYIQHHLYDPYTGYFSRQVKIGGKENRGLSTPINFNRLLDEDDFQLSVKSVYKQGGSGRTSAVNMSCAHSDDVGYGSWLTPVELFRPWYGYAIADHILAKATQHGTINPRCVEIFEIGGGSGTCMIDVLDRIHQRDPDIYKKTTYTCIEISKRLVDTQVARAKSAGLDEYRWTVIHADFLSLDEELPSSEERTFVLALELLDNLPHDKVMFDDKKQSWEAVIVPTTEKTGERLKKTKQVVDFVMSFSYTERKTLKSETLQELYRPASDPLLLRMIDEMQELEETFVKKEKEKDKSMLDSVQNILLGYGNLRYSKTGVLTPASAVRTKQGIAYIPTGQLRFLEALHRCFPYHSVLISDFDSLPGLVLPGAGGPAVQSLGSGHRICDRSSYLLPPKVSADIFFPTDFISLQQLYEKITGNSTNVFSAKEFFAPFDESLRGCRTLSGYCPLTEYYSNTSYLVETDR